MKRLSSNIIYFVAFGFPVIIIPFIFFDFSEDATFLSVLFYVFLLACLCYTTYISFNSKRIYYRDNTLFLFDLFTKKRSILRKNRLKGVDRVIATDPTFYKITYVDYNNKIRYVYFMRNHLLPGAGDIINKLNSPERIIEYSDTFVG